MAGVLRTLEIQAGHNNSFETIAGDNVIVVGVAANPASGANITSVTFNGVAVTELVEKGGGTQFDCFVWLGILISPDIGSYALAVSGSNIDAWVSEVVFFIQTGVVETGQPRDTDSSEDSLNDVLAVNLTTILGDLCLYMGHKGGAGTPAWSGIDGQSSLVADSAGAYEVATGVATAANWGESGVDDKIAACGVSLKAAIAKSVIGGAIS